MYEHDAISQHCASSGSGAVIFAEYDVTAVRVGGVAALLDDAVRDDADATSTSTSSDDETFVALVATSERVVNTSHANNGMCTISHVFHDDSHIGDTNGFTPDAVVPRGSTAISLGTVRQCVIVSVC